MPRNRSNHDLLAHLPAHTREAFKECTPNEQEGMLDTVDAILNHARPAAFSTSRTPANTPGTAAGFAARVDEKMQAPGVSRGKAILLARNVDHKGFAEWEAAGRPEHIGAVKSAPDTAGKFSARIRSYMTKGNSRGRAILLARADSHVGFSAWSNEGRPE